jgi:hypothetical protein
MITHVCENDEFVKLDDCGQKSSTWNIIKMSVEFNDLGNQKSQVLKITKLLFLILVNKKQKNVRGELI